MSALPPAATNAGYIDLQVNGFAGLDFNGDSLDAQEMHNACLRLREDGAVGFLPTVITSDLPSMCARLRRLVEFSRSDDLGREMILGLHIEGPFISKEPGYVGAHPPEAVRPAHLDELKQLLDAADGLTRIVTLAPEHDVELRMTRYLADQGIVVSAGHCNPTLEQLQTAIDAGLSMFTHLGNACANLVPKHDNIIQSALSQSDRLWLSFIADGAHVPFPALRNYLRAAGLERCVVVSDAMSATGLGPGRYPVGDQTVYVGEDCIPRADEGSHLVGSATPVSKMRENLRTHLNLSADQVRQLTLLGPRQILGLD